MLREVVVIEKTLLFYARWGVASSVRIPFADNSRAGCYEHSSDGISAGVINFAAGGTYCVMVMPPLASVYLIY